jgi:hypothetical protein
MIACLAGTVKCSNISALLARRLAPARVLLVDGLPAHLQGRRDLLPRPALVACVVDVQALQLVQQPPQRHHGPQAHLWVLARDLTGEIRRGLVGFRVCQVALTRRET